MNFGDDCDLDGELLDFLAWLGAGGATIVEGRAIFHRACGVDGGNLNMPLEAAVNLYLTSVRP